ncbi:MAG: DNA-directed RNA polymerase subunit beta', partial [Defluviitaleaceae bacterium]|nr:DNA-directed RNA polymerase subunit beta' [Defluviitaleaceae bacterium]
CPAYNADFDGDQMSVHLPLSVEAQAECRFLLLAPNNLLKPSDGAPITVPTQDMVLGIYYLTIQKENDKGDGKYFKDPEEALLAYDNGIISLHARIMVRRTMNINGAKQSMMVETTVGRIIFNEAIPQDIGFVNRSIPENRLKYEVDFLCDKKTLQRIINRCINKYGSTETAIVLDKIKDLGFRFSTRGALTVSVSDMEIPGAKAEIIAAAEKEVEDATKMYRRGLMTDEERHDRVIALWNIANDKITEHLMEGLGKYNNIHMMAASGARGSTAQIKQLAGMRGLMSNPSGGVIELPIKSNFREGLSVLEYFSSAHGARKVLSDTALKTADSGYLTRRLVDVSQDVIIREFDCAYGESSDTDENGVNGGFTVISEAGEVSTTAGRTGKIGEVPYMEVSAFVDKAVEGTDSYEVIESLHDRVNGRWSVENIVNPQTGKIIVYADNMITPDQAEEIEKVGVDKVKIRTILTCRSRIGLCSKCYGANMASGRIVRVGESVGIIAAQSIGEPGTQLTMRNFHTGGIASGEDITQGLPRVEELFEARKPKGLAIIAEFPGYVAVSDTKKKREVIITNPETGDMKEYLIPYGSRVCVTNGEYIEAGDEITEGSIYPHDILKIKGLRGVQDYMLQEVQRVYRLQGVDINDKHIEVIVRQMLKRVRVEENNDSQFLPGSLIDWLDFEEQNSALAAQGLEPAVGARVLLGITKASLATDSFLSAASFQETTRVLTEAAIKGKIDPLIGLKENVIIGKLIPAGTGMQLYRNINVVKSDAPNDAYEKYGFNNDINNDDNLPDTEGEEHDNARYAEYTD